MIRAAVWAAALSAGLARADAPAAAPAPAAATAPRATMRGGEPVELRAVDGWVLRAAWGRAQPGKPTVVLLHGTGQRKEDWRLMTRALSARGIGWLAVDMRGHGESRVSPSGERLNWHKLNAQRDLNDYEDMTRDAEAGVGWLAGQGVPEESIGLMGAEVGGSVAVKYAAVHPKVPFVVLLSPAVAWREVPIVNAIRAYKGRPILLVYSEADRRSSREAPILYQFARLSAGPDHAAQFVVAQERGTRMLRADRGLIAEIAGWIENPVPPAPAISAAAVAGAAVSTGAASAASVSTATAPAAPAPAAAPAAGDAL